MYSKVKTWAKTYLHRRMLVVFMLGFSSGLPLALCGGTLQAWFKTSGAGIVLIGFIALISQPYSYKFLWAPLLDKFVPSRLLDRRRSWMLLMQLFIIAIIAMMAFFKPDASVTIFNMQIPTLLLLGLFLSTCSATQDIAIDAYRVEVLKRDERGLGTALGIEGYRIAMIASGGFALVIAETYGWQTTYLCMAALMGVGVLATLIGPKVSSALPQSNTSLATLVIASFKDFFNSR